VTTVLFSLTTWSAGSRAHFTQQDLLEFTTNRTAKFGEEGVLAITIGKLAANFLLHMTNGLGQCRSTDPTKGRWVIR
jgi:hypothetical protein